MENKLIGTSYMYPNENINQNTTYINQLITIKQKKEGIIIIGVYSITNLKTNKLYIGESFDIDKRWINHKNDLLNNIKSIRYLESDNYRNILSFIESEPYQVFVMGHSCGNSDRTLLNTLFEHQNCVSIKPFYYVNKNGVDNYLDIVKNIYRNFTDMKLMRAKVVNKSFCEPLS